MGELMSDNECSADGSVRAAEPGITEVTLDGNLLPAAFRMQSSQITDDVIHYVAGEVTTPAPCKSATIMRSLVDDLLRTRLTSMRQMADRLDVRQPDDVLLLDSVATAMFDDDVVTWGRVVTLFAFAGYLSRHCRERNRYDCAEAVVQVLDAIVVERLGLWIVVNGGWESFERQFPSIGIFEAGSLWKVVVMVAMLCGAAFAFYSSLQFVSQPTRK